jgi:hypothetical protein
LSLSLALTHPGCGIASAQNIGGPVSRNRSNGTVLSNKVADKQIPKNEPQISSVQNRYCLIVPQQAFFTPQIRSADRLPRDLSFNPVFVIRKALAFAPTARMSCLSV